MKTKKDKKLSINKETIAHLEIAQLAQIVGGTGPTGGTDDTNLDCDPKIPTNACTK